MNGYYYFAVRSEQSGLAGGVVGMVMVEWRQGLVPRRGRWCYCEVPLTGLCLSVVRKGLVIPIEYIPLYTYFSSRILFVNSVIPISSLASLQRCNTNETFKSDNMNIEITSEEK